MKQFCLEELCHIWDLYGASEDENAAPEGRYRKYVDVYAVLMMHGGW